MLERSTVELAPPVAHKREAETQPESEPQAKRHSSNELFTMLDDRIFIDPTETDISVIVNGLFKSALTHIPAEQDGNCFFSCIGLACRTDVGKLRSIAAETFTTDEVLTFSSLCFDVSVGEQYADSKVVTLMHNTKLPDVCAENFPLVRDQLIHQYRQLIIQNSTHADMHAIAAIANAMELVRSKYL